MFLKKLLIPAYTPGFEIKRMISPAVLPEDLAALGRHNFVPLSDDYFEAFNQKVHRFIEERAAAGDLARLVAADVTLPAEPASSR